ncbi:MAG TPA: sulfite exporter TauE/SafE family protein [Thermomicrobiales bacterium]|nr:sulfite exporter TauE/SafE family protein [Thermomicrobiales bacterium]
MANGPLLATLLGGVVVVLASALGGATGFGYALLAAPLLLLLGFPLPFVVTANLALALLTRVAVAYRFRPYLHRRRAALLILGSVPGLYAGTRVLTGVAPATIRRVAGVAIVLVALLLLRSLKAPPPPPLPGAPLAAGFLGGFLGATISLNGVPAVLLLARDRASPYSVQADLALYFVVSNAIGLGLLALRHALVAPALYPAALLWLPGALLGNYAGVALGARLPQRAFRYLALAIACAAGVVTALTA